MDLGSSKDSIKIKKTVAYYNMVPNLVWSILNLSPISVFCFNFLNFSYFYIFLGISFLPIFLKNSFLDKLQISKNTKTYQKIGVHLVNYVTQNGAIINGLIKNRFPTYRVVTNKKSSLARLINQTYLFEKFHLIFFLFFTLVIIYALGQDYFYWAFVIFITNIVYNIYPNLLQQYLRLRLKLFTKKLNENMNG